MPDSDPSKPADLSSWGSGAPLACPTSRVKRLPPPSAPHVPLHLFSQIGFGQLHFTGHRPRRFAKVLTLGPGVEAGLVKQES